MENKPYLILLILGIILSLPLFYMTFRTVYVILSATLEGFLKMKLTTKKDTHKLLFNYHVNDHKIIINLMHKYPDSVSFCEKQQLISIKKENDNETMELELRPTHLIDVDIKNIVIEKDQIILPYQPKF